MRRFHPFIAGRQADIGANVIAQPDPQRPRPSGPPYPPGAPDHHQPQSQPQTPGEAETAEMLFGHETGQSGAGRQGADRGRNLCHILYPPSQGGPLSMDKMNDRPAPPWWSLATGSGSDTRASLRSHGGPNRILLGSYGGPILQASQVLPDGAVTRSQETRGETSLSGLESVNSQSAQQAGTAQATEVAPHRGASRVATGSGFSR